VLNLKLLQYLVKSSGLFVFQVIPNYSSRDLYDKLFALGVTMYGQMTAGSYCYIGPQGIVHGTTVGFLCCAIDAFLLKQLFLPQLILPFHHVELYQKISDSLAIAKRKQNVV